MKKSLRQEIFSSLFFSFPLKLAQFQKISKMIDSVISKYQKTSHNWKESLHSQILKLLPCHLYLNHLGPMLPFYILFSGVQNENIGHKWVKYFCSMANISYLHTRPFYACIRLFLQQLEKYVSYKKWNYSMQYHIRLNYFSFNLNIWELCKRFLTK